MPVVIRFAWSLSSLKVELQSRTSQAKQIHQICGESLCFSVLKFVPIFPFLAIRHEFPGLGLQETQKLVGFGSWGSNPPLPNE